MYIFLQRLHLCGVLLLFFQAEKPSQLYAHGLEGGVRRMGPRRKKAWTRRTCDLKEERLVEK